MKWRVAAVVVAVAVVGAVIATRDRGDRGSGPADAGLPASASGSPGDVRAADEGTAVVLPPERHATATTPVLPNAAVSRPAAGTPDTFNAQIRDPEWANGRETRLRAAVRGIEREGAAIGDIECRQSACRILVSGTSAAVVLLIEELSEDRGVIAGSESLSLSRLPESTDALRTAVLLHYVR